jgi:hypothetical protein
VIGHACWPIGRLGCACGAVPTPDCDERRAAAIYAMLSGRR